MPTEPEPLGRSRQILLLTLGGLVVLVACGVFFNRFYHNPDFFPPHDFLQYWAAGRLNATGGNPYDATTLLALQKEAGRPHDHAVLMWNPPWSLALVMPFGMIPPRTSQLLWVVGQYLLMTLAAGVIWQMYGGKWKQVWIAWGIAAVAPMTLSGATAGQSSGWLVLGLMGFLTAVVRGRSANAALTAICALKPHLFIPFWILLVLDATRSREARARLAWGIAGGVAASGIVLAVNPIVWSQYLDAMQSPASDFHIPLSAWEPPLLGYWVRVKVDPASFWIQFVPTGIVAALTPLYWWVRRTNWNWSIELPRVLFVGAISAPYGAWDYDLIILLVPVLVGAIRLMHSGTEKQLRLAVVGSLIYCLAAIESVVGKYDVWMTPVLIGAYIWVMKSVSAPSPWEVGSVASSLSSSPEPQRCP